MLTWSTNKSLGYSCYRHLEAKSKDAIVASVDIRTADFNWVRIRAVWRKCHDFSGDHRPPAANDFSLVSTDDKIKNYCEYRWKEWLKKAGLV